MIVPVKFLLIHLDTKTFNRILRFIRCNEGGGTDLKMSIEEFSKIYNPDTAYEFIRLKHGEYYVDIKLFKFLPNYDFITLSFGRVIDYNRLRYISKPKNK